MHRRLAIVFIGFAFLWPQWQETELSWANTLPMGCLLVEKPKVEKHRTTCRMYNGNHSSY